MYLSLFIGVLVLVCSCSMCASSRDEPPEAARTEADPAPPVVPPPMAPNQVRVSATSIASQKEPRGDVLTVRIDTVAGYGAGTPPLAVGTEIDVQVPQHLIDQLEPAVLDAMRTPGRVSTFTLMHQPASALLDSDRTPWRAVVIQ